MSTQTLRTKSLTTTMTSAVLFTLVFGCASQQPASQLLDAQRTYEAASSGMAAEYAPDELLAAKELLDKAHDQKNGSAQQIQYSYLADRQARLASSSGTIEYYQNQAALAQDNYVLGLEKRSSSAEQELERTRTELTGIEQELQNKDANVEQLSARKAELEQRKLDLESKLSEKEVALDQSEKARQDAEARAKAALASLNTLALVKEEANETVITLSGSVLFKTGEAELLPIAETSLSKVAQAIKSMDDKKTITIEGHTDSRGAEEMNKELSQKRAQSVMNYLAQQGVAQARMTAIGKGESAPVAENETPEGRANNRRVELRISGGAETGNSATRTTPQKTAGSS